MKKAFFAGLTVLMALVMVTCDLNETGNKPEITYDTDGTPLVNLTIKTGGTPSRALSEALAKDWVDYYEVAFVSPDGKIFRARWKLGTVGRIAVPHGNYNTVDPTAVDPTNSSDTTGAAVMFAGRYDTKNLLAVGYLKFTSNTEGETSTTIIDHDTISVTFELTALSINVQVDTPATSSFQITKTGYETASILSADFPQVKYNSELVPVFEVDTDYDTDATPATWTSAGTIIDVTGDTVELSDTTGINANDTVRIGGTEFTVLTVDDGTHITLTSATGISVGDSVETQATAAVAGHIATATSNSATYTIVGHGETTFPYNEGVFLMTPKLISVGVLAQNPTKVGGFALDLTVSTIAAQTPSGNGVIPSDGIFELDLVVPPNKSGLSWLAIDIPVRAISATPDINGDIWHIQGGLRNGDFDLGADKQSLGGAILLGADIDITIEIEINSTWK